MPLFDFPFHDKKKAFIFARHKKAKWKVISIDFFHSKLCTPLSSRTVGWLHMVAACLLRSCPWPWIGIGGHLRGYYNHFFWLCTIPYIKALRACRPLNLIVRPPTTDDEWQGNNNGTFWWILLPKMPHFFEKVVYRWKQPPIDLFMEVALCTYLLKGYANVDL